MSSDSDDDDCYGNIAQRLQKMKNKYQEDKIESTNLLDASNELDEMVLNSNLDLKQLPKSQSSDLEDSPGPTVSKSSQVSPIKNPVNRSKRTTRSAAKSCTSDELVPPELPPQRSNRRSKTANAGESSTSSPRGRGQGMGRGSQNTRAATPRSRGRGRNRRNWRSIHSFMDQVMPTYSIGDADEVYDMSSNQALFSSKPINDVMVIEENDPLDLNEELSVKVYWQSCEYVKFTIRKFQKLTQIFDYFVKEKSVEIDNLLFTYNDRILKPDDTPDSINYNIVKFIDGGIVNQSVSKLVSKDMERFTDGVKLKFQCQNVKKPFELIVKLDEKFSLAMTKCSEHLEVPLSKLKFEFDGDSITANNTARDMELEGGECIDVKICS